MYSFLMAAEAHLKNSFQRYKRELGFIQSAGLSSFLHIYIYVLFPLQQRVMSQKFKSTILFSYLFNFFVFCAPCWITQSADILYKFPCWYKRYKRGARFGCATWADRWIYHLRCCCTMGSAESRTLFRSQVKVRETDWIWVWKKDCSGLCKPTLCYWL